MDPSSALYGLAKHLLTARDDPSAADLLLKNLVSATGAQRGFIVVSENGSYEQKFDVRFDRQSVSADERRFSRSLVQQAIATKKPIHSSNLGADPSFSAFESVQSFGLCAVLVVPLVDEEEVFGVVYLEKRDVVKGFAEAERDFASEFAQLAGAWLHRAAERDAARSRVQRVVHDLFEKHDFEGIVTRDPKMIQLLTMVAQVADSTASVLISGENGTGKELVAHALHANSARAKKPFIPILTTALPSNMLESELFGHVRGAFTGADRDRQGRIASAHGGTLFLDEIAEIPLEVQAKLLRFLQEREIQKLGSDKIEKVDVRVLSATHQDLAALVKTGRFRQDLLYRLKVVELKVPPLRDRPTDIPILVDHFAKRFWRRDGEQPLWTVAARRRLDAHPYPGNVRELSHAIERACLLATGPTMDVEHLPPEMIEAPPGFESPPRSVRFARFDSAELDAAREGAQADVESWFLDGLLKKHDGNVSAAARESGLNRTYLQKLLARYRKRGADGSDAP